MGSCHGAVHSACRHTVHHETHCIAWSVPLEAVLEDEAEAIAVATAVCRSCAFAAEVACALSADAHILILIHGVRRKRGGEKKEKSTTFGINLTRSLVVYWAAQRGGEKERSIAQGNIKIQSLPHPQGCYPYTFVFTSHICLGACIYTACNISTVHI